VYPLTTHCSCDGDAPVARPIDGNATFVTLTSSKVMNSAEQQTISASQRREPGSTSSATTSRA
jgi:hypothetical protein